MIGDHLALPVYALDMPWHNGQTKLLLAVVLVSQDRLEAEAQRAALEKALAGAQADAAHKQVGGMGVPTNDSMQLVFQVFSVQATVLRRGTDA
jgi:hypothetical protein